MQAMVTERIAGIASSITGQMHGVKDKSTAIWDHVRSIPYDLFSVTSRDVDDLVGKPLTCYGKALLQASLLEAEKIPWQFEISMCPSTRVEETVNALGEKEPSIKMLFSNFRNIIKGSEMFHTAVQVKGNDGNWMRMDSTIPPDVCNKMKDPENKEKCLSMDNITAVHKCRVIGHGREIPAMAVNAWSGLSRVARWLGGR